MDSNHEKTIKPDAIRGNQKQGQHDPDPNSPESVGQESGITGIEPIRLGGADSQRDDRQPATRRNAVGKTLRYLINALSNQVAQSERNSERLAANLEEESALRDKLLSDLADLQSLLNEISK